MKALRSRRRTISAAVLAAELSGYYLTRGGWCGVGGCWGCGVVLGGLLLLSGTRFVTVMS